MTENNNHSPSGQDLSSSITLFFKARRGDTSALNVLYGRYLPRLSQWTLQGCRK